MSGLGDRLRDYLNSFEERVDPVRAKRREYERETEDQPGRALKRESKPERGYIPRNASGGIDEEEMGRLQNKFQVDEEEKRIGDSYERLRRAATAKKPVRNEKASEESQKILRNQAEVIGSRG